MKKIFLLMTFFIGLGLSAQSKYLTKKGSVAFEASVPSFEEVKASHNSVTAIVNSENGEFAALVLIKGFRFKNALMEEHFNENYAESDTYPKATFKGQILDFSLNKLNAQKQSFLINGQLTFHGKTKQLDSTNIDITQNEGLITISGAFLANASDFDIKIPKVVKNKIANDINVSFNFSLKKK
ncbi:YceI family protein [Flavivirga spongiicola]|uniref:YceI family protein n=1 Tax=Flavivirga spongiicola TaxID=421621 RepID=A0ABU7XPI7_9FLAO|nr:YceI family protein [Flavivirga sp. MEBiC05379]MDO5977694.1 YceI family protein [Flavivirga sp. MEBiC05379]